MSLGWITGVSVMYSFVAFSITDTLGNNQKSALPSLTAAPDMVMLSCFPGSCYLGDFIGSILGGKSDHFLPWLRSIQGAAGEAGIRDDYNVEIADRFLLVCVHWSLSVADTSLLPIPISGATAD